MVEQRGDLIRERKVKYLSTTRPVQTGERRAVSALSPCGDNCPITCGDNCPDDGDMRFHAKFSWQNAGSGVLTYVKCFVNLVRNACRSASPEADL